jgi:hypothetical protein
MKGVSTDTLRLRKINVSLFLTVLIFCCLLFMEEEEEEKEKEEESAYENLCTDLGKLLDKLHDLRIDINNRKIIITGAIDGKIDSLIQMVDSARLYVIDNVPNKEIRANINIVSQVGEAQGYLSRFSKQSHHSSDELDILLGEIEKIWKEQIQDKVEEAVRNAPR